MQPQIISFDKIEGAHNADLEAAGKRLDRSATYKDLSTVIVCPTRGVIPARVVESWMQLYRPMNNKVYGPIFIQGAEVGEAYNAAVAAATAKESGTAAELKKAQAAEAAARAALEAAKRALDATSNAAKDAAARSAKAAADVDRFKALIAELEKAKNTESKVAEALTAIAAGN